MNTQVKPGWKFVTKRVTVFAVGLLEICFTIGVSAGSTGTDSDLFVGLEGAGEAAPVGLVWPVEPAEAVGAYRVHT